MTCDTITRQRLAAAALASVATIALTVASAVPATAQPRAVSATQPPVDDGLPMPGFDVEPGRTALVITDPQNALASISAGVTMVAYVRPAAYEVCAGNGASNALTELCLREKASNAERLHNAALKLLLLLLGCTSCCL